jgi:adenylyltransferase/sulfurtransferase
MPFLLPDRDRFARHRAIDWWDQDRLCRATVVLAGCGALGNEVGKNLALLGVGTVVLIDFDRIEESNLVRSVLFRPGDLGRAKAAVAAERLAALHPGGRFVPVEGDLWCDLGLGVLRGADLAIGCLDSVNARFALNRLAMRAGTPWLDGGLGVVACQVARYDPDSGACYECQLSPDTARRFAERYSCAGLARPARGGATPTTAISAALAGSLVAAEALWILFGRAGGLQAGQRLTAHFAPYRLEVDTLPADPACCAHGAIGEVARAGHPADLTVRQVLCELPDREPRSEEGAASSTRPAGPEGGPSGSGRDAAADPATGYVDLGFDLVVAWICPRCGEMPLETPRPRAKTRREEAVCPACGTERAVDWISAIEPEMPWADRPLIQLGVPEHHVLGIGKPGAHFRYVQLAGTLIRED